MLKDSPITNTFFIYIILIGGILLISESISYGFWRSEFMKANPDTLKQISNSAAAFNPGLDTSALTLRRSDSNKISERNKLLSGYLNLETTYGDQPLYFGVSGNALMNRTTGEVSINSFLPMKLNFEYFQVGNYISRSNFLISFDKDQFTKTQLSRKAQHLDGGNYAMDSLNNQISGLYIKKNYYLRKLQGINSTISSIEQASSNYQEPIQITDSVSIIPSLVLDSSFVPDNNSDYTDSSIIGIANFQNSQQLYLLKDSSEYFSNLVSKTDSLINVLANEKLKLAGELNDFNSNTANHVKVIERGFLNSIKNVNIGNFTCNSTKYMLRSVSLFGAKLELEGDHYLMLASGLIQSSHEYENYSVPNYLTDLGSTFGLTKDDQNSQQVFVIKGGLGSLDATHFHIGYAYAKGRGNSFYLEENTGSRFTNKTLELDGRIKLGTESSLGITFGQSFQGSKGYTLSNADISNMLHTKLGKALGVDLKFKANVVKSNIDIKFEYISPEFQSIGIYSYMNDLARAEINVTTRINSRWSFQHNLRQTRSNITSASQPAISQTMVRQRIGYKINRRVSLVIVNSPCISIYRRDEILDEKVLYYYGTLILTINPRVKKLGSHITSSITSNIYNSSAYNSNYFEFKCLDRFDLKQSIGMTIGTKYLFRQLTNDNSSQFGLIISGTANVGKVVFESGAEGNFDLNSGDIASFSFNSGACVNFNKYLSFGVRYQMAFENWISGIDYTNPNQFTNQNNYLTFNVRTTLQ